jgi:ornithine carbamoyltransferase
MPDLIALDELAAGDIMALTSRAASLKRAWDERSMPRSLVDRRIALILDDGGWRNTTAFDLGIAAMGGICVSTPIKLSGRETIEDLAGYLDNWFDAIVIRSPSLQSLHDLARAASSPVINARTRENHPCETLGDLSYLASTGARLDGLHVVAVAPDGNILRSWIEAAAVLPITVTQVFPERWHAKVDRGSSPGFRSTGDLKAVSDADVVITDCWPDHQAADGLLSYQVTSALLATAKPTVAFLPCPPVTRGMEVSAEVMASPLMQSPRAKSFLLHAQNAALEWCLQVAR